MAATMPHNWKRTAVDIPTKIKKELSVICAKNSLTLTKLVNSFAIALITGDLTIENNALDSIRIIPKVGDNIDDLVRVNYFDREGNHVNPTKYKEGV
jgi:hypothetical protein